MDTLYKFSMEKKWTDLELILDDGSNKLTIYVHKILMIKEAPYFEKLLTFNNESSFTLNVPNANITYDLILSFYGQSSNKGSSSKWYHALATAKCRDYFGLDISMPTPTDITIGDFDYFLELCGMVGIDEELAKVISENLPLDYDLDKLSKSMLEMLIDSMATFVTMTVDDDNIRFWDTSTGNFLQEFVTNTFEPHILFCPNPNYIIVEDDVCRIYNINTGEIYFEMDMPTNILSLSPDGKYIAFVIGISIYILDFDKRKLTFYRSMENIASIHISPFNKYLVVRQSMMINILDFATGKFSRKIEYKDDYHYNFRESIAFSTDNKYIIMGYDEYFIESKIWHADTGLIMDMDGLLTCVKDENLFVGMSFLQNPLKNENYVAFKEGSKVHVYDLTNNMVINSFYIRDCDDAIFSPNNKMLALVYSKNIMIYEIGSGKKLYESTNYKSIKFSPNSLYAVLSYKNILKIINIIDGSTLYMNDDAKEKIFYDDVVLDFSPDSRFLVYASNDGHIINCDISRGCVKSKVEGILNNRIFMMHSGEKAKRLLEYMHKIDG